MTASSMLLPSLAGANTDTESVSDRTVQQVTSGNWLDTQNRQAVIDGYNAEFSAALPAMGWTGDDDTCDVGTISPAYRSATIDRVNWYRAMAGVPAVTENLDLSDSAQTATLIQAFVPLLEHEPEPGATCYTPDGRDASKHSNLTRGFTGLRGIDSFVRDPGDGNKALKHRNWLLNPTSQQFGVGAIEGVNDQRTVTVLRSDDVANVATPPMRESESFVAWPAYGYTPSQVVYDRWSFGIRDADFSAATVQTERLVDGELIEVASSVVSAEPSDAAPVNLIVWEPELDFSSPTNSLPTPAADETYRVTIGNVGVGNAIKTFTYDVTVIGDEFAPRPDAVALVTEVERTPLEQFLASPELNSEHSMVLRLYWAVFDRAPDVGGARFWVADYTSGSRSLSEITSHFVDSPEFVERYGNDLSNEAFVREIYLNVLDREPDAEGYAFWVDQLETGASSRADLVLFFSDSAEFKESHPLPSDSVAP